MKKCFIIIVIAAAFLYGCYSFTGGSVPEHLATLNIATVEDRSGFADPRYRDILTDELIKNFEDDGTFRLVERNSDARLEAVITGIREEPISVTQGELESERKITISIDVEYTDLVMKKQVWKKVFSNYGVFEVANAQAGRQEALTTAVEQSAEDILFAVVSGW